jgi:hypothetical protein
MTSHGVSVVSLISFGTKLGTVTFLTYRVLVLVYVPFFSYMSMSDIVTVGLAAVTVREMNSCIRFVCERLCLMLFDINNVD